MDKRILCLVGGHVLVIFMPRFAPPNTNPHRHLRVCLTYIFIIYTRASNPNLNSPCVFHFFFFSTVVSFSDTCWHWTKDHELAMQRNGMEETRALMDGRHVFSLIFGHTHTHTSEYRTYRKITLNPSKRISFSPCPIFDAKSIYNFHLSSFLAGMLHHAEASVDLSWAEIEDKSSTSRHWIQFA